MVSKRRPCLSLLPAPFLFCRSLCRTAKEKCESVLGIVGLQWPEDSDCSQFPEDGGNFTCLLPEAGVDGTHTQKSSSV